MNNTHSRIGHQYSRCCCHIIPPHMVDEMIKCGDKKISVAAIENKAAAGKARAARATLASLRPAMAAMRMMSALPVSTKKNRTIHDAKKKSNLDG